MKKAVLTLAMVAQSLFVFAEKVKHVVYVKNDEVKMYQQAGTASPLLKALSSTDEIEFVRKFNDQWSIVVFLGQPGYILTSELYSANTAQAKTAKKQTLAQK